MAKTKNLSANFEHATTFDVTEIICTNRNKTLLVFVPAVWRHSSLREVEPDRL
jgi:hypothetical protein